MIWSYKELANLSLIGENAVVERVMKHLGDSENQDIFEKENFSYLWGALGIVGIKGVQENVLDRIWRSLKENGVLDAFDKGMLGDFNLVLMRKYSDNRLKAWKNFDNFTADQRFKRLVLMPIVAHNRKYAQEVDTQAFNPMRVLGILERYPMSDAVKMMLKNLHGHGAACGVLGVDIIEHYEKEKILYKLCDIIAYSKRVLHEDEKDFLFRYIHDALFDGFLPENIGLRDEVFAGLMSDRDDMENMSELELSHLRERNAEIVEFAKKFDVKLGFFEKSAVKLIRYNPAYISEMVQRCIGLMNLSEPKGVVFALELVNMKQIKSAVKVLIELAKRGKATEMASFLYRLLLDVNGAETMIVNILKLNLKMLKEKSHCWENSFFREYPARIYISAVKVLEENGLYKDAGDLLYTLVMEDWIVGIKDLEEECVDTANLLLSKHKDLDETLSLVANKLNLNMYRGGDEVYILYNAKAGVSGRVRKTYERFLGDIKEIGLKGVSKGIDKLNQIKENIKQNNEELNENTKDDLAYLEVKEEVDQGMSFDEVQIEDAEILTNFEEDAVYLSEEKTEENNIEEENVAKISNDNFGDEAVVNIDEEIIDNTINDDVYNDGEVLEGVENEEITTSVVNDDVEELNVKEVGVERIEEQQNIEEVVAENLDEQNVEGESFEEVITENQGGVEENFVEEVIENEAFADNAEKVEQNFVSEDFILENMVEIENKNNNEFVSVFGDKEENAEDVFVNGEEKEVNEYSTNDENENEIKIVENTIKQWDDGETDIDVLEPKGVKKFLKINKNDLDKHFEKIKEITSNTIKRVDNVDKHFDKIKEITNDVVKRAEEKAIEIKEKVEEKNIENIKGIAGIKKIADKFKGFRKKQ